MFYEEDNDFNFESLFKAKQFEIAPQNFEYFPNAISWPLATEDVLIEERKKEAAHYLGFLIHQVGPDNWSMRSNIYLPKAGRNVEFDTHNLYAITAKHLFCVCAEECARHYNYRNGTTEANFIPPALAQEIRFFSSLTDNEPSISVSYQLMLPPVDLNSRYAEEVTQEFFKNIPTDKEPLQRSLDELVKLSKLNNDLAEMLMNLGPVTQFVIARRQADDGEDYYFVHSVDDKGNLISLLRCERFTTAAYYGNMLQNGYLTKAFQEDPAQQNTQDNYLMHFNNWCRSDENFIKHIRMT